MNTPTQLLRHLAIIPDGNRRWAKKNSISAEARMYEEGGRKIAEIAEAAFDKGVTYLTLWGSSYANLASRPKALVGAIDKIYEQKFVELATHPIIFEQKVHIEVLGEWRSMLGVKTIAAAQRAIDATKDHSERFLTVLIGYDGRRERGASVQQLLKERPESPGDFMDADALLKKYSWTGHLPDVDLVIRTGAWSDPHNSANFLGFLTGETQLAFPEVLWPDFTADMLKDICDDFAGRERRHGR